MHYACRPLRPTLASWRASPPSRASLPLTHRPGTQIARAPGPLGLQRGTARTKCRQAQTALPVQEQAFTLDSEPDPYHQGASIIHSAAASPRRHFPTKGCAMGLSSLEYWQARAPHLPRRRHVRQSTRRARHRRSASPIDTPTKVVTVSSPVPPGARRTASISRRGQGSTTGAHCRRFPILSSGGQAAR